MFKHIHILYSKYAKDYTRMQEPKFFCLENIHEILMGRLHQTSISWQGEKQIFSHKEPDIRLNEEGIVSFGALALCTAHLWQSASHAASLSPLFIEKGITATLWMRSDTPTAVELADEARALKNKIATHIGWLLPLTSDMNEAQLKKLEEAPAVCGFWIGAEYIKNVDIPLLSHINKPIVIDTDGIDISAYEQLLKSFIALKKRPIILNGPLFHPRDYESLVELQSIATIVSARAGGSIGGVYMPIFSHLTQLYQKYNFWANWLDGDKDASYWQIFFASQKVYKSYENFRLMFKGRKMPGYDADIVVLDEDFTPKIVITGGSIAYWKGEFMREFRGQGLRIW